MTDRKTAVTEECLCVLAKRWGVAVSFARKVKTAKTVLAARALWGSTTPGSSEEKVARGNLKRRCRERLRRAIEAGDVPAVKEVATFAPPESSLRRKADRFLGRVFTVTASRASMPQASV